MPEILSTIEQAERQGEGLVQSSFLRAGFLILVFLLVFFFFAFLLARYSLQRFAVRQDTRVPLRQGASEDRK